MRILDAMTPSGTVGDVDIPHEMCTPAFRKLKWAVDSHINSFSMSRYAAIMKIRYERSTKLERTI